MTGDDGAHGTPRNGGLPGCLILTGTPGAGKTTVSRLVAARLPRAARIDGDTVAQMIVSGRVGVTAEPAAESRRQLRLRARNICSLADNFAEAGFVPVLDHVVPDREVLDFMVASLTVRPVLLVVLAPPLAVSERRNAGRAERERVPYDFAVLHRGMRAELGGTGWWLDTGAQTPAETADAVLAGAAARAVVAD